MERFRFMKLLGEKKKVADIPAANESGVPTGSNEAIPSPSILTMSGQIKEPKGGLRASIRKRFVTNKSENKTRSPNLIVKDSGSIQVNPMTDGVESHPQTESLSTQRQNFDLPDDPNYQRKIDAIDYGIQIVDHFNDLAGVIALVTPDALGRALSIITKILEKLKVCCSSYLDYDY
jgi:hypothetical protein